MTYHPTVDTIKKLLSEHDCEYDYFEHEPVRTSEEASKVRPGYGLKQGAKAIIVRVKESGKGKRFVMLVMPADKKFDTAKLETQFGFKEIRFAMENEINEITGGILPGGVPPFGNLFNLEVIVDSSLFDNEKIVFNAGDKCVSIGMKSQDYKKIVNPTLSDIVA